ncbi:MAG: hypothetical protein PVG85_07520 [Deltaproteobacteria bacterium]|jgi:hypothetical protein
MISVRQQKTSIASIILLHLFLLLLSGPSVVHADGEEPFIGVIEDLSKDSITVRVTKVLYSPRALGDQARLLISKDMAIREIKGQSSKVIPFEKLSLGSSIWIKPNTLANQDVEASVVIVEHEPSRATRRTR